jgi:peroxiredoxin
VAPVLAQNRAAVRRFVEETGVPFNILVDEERTAARAYGVYHRAGLTAWNIARPALFIIDRRGILRHVWVGEGSRQYPSHAEVLAALGRL